MDEVRLRCRREDHKGQSGFCYSLNLITFSSILLFSLARSDLVSTSTFCSP
jgi:hypothetical protein